MLKNTFCHIPGIGPRLENRLWAQGIHSWDKVLERKPAELPPSCRSSLCAHVRKSIDEFKTHNAVYFADLLPGNEKWRLFPEFRDSVAYFDIETTGLRPELSTVTTIALYDGSEVRYYVHGRNLDDFVDDIQRYRLLVTYNGKCFDIPFIERYFDIEINAAHIDLRFVLASMGYKGGLKGCEKQLGIDRGDLDGVDGYFAVLLWYEFMESGSERVLETLLAYNIEDVVNLEQLMVLAYNMKVEKTPFADSHRCVTPNPPSLPFTPDAKTIKKIRDAYYR
jgi:uncharacterized protein YprB with RNaseH-like and TPR domain